MEGHAAPLAGTVCGSGMKSKTVIGRRPAIASFVCAALAVAPVVFGPLGVIAGMVAVWKGDVWWGAAGVSGSAVAAVVGYYWAAELVG